MEVEVTTLKQAAARGALHNLLFAGGGSLLTYLQFLLVMRFLGPAQIGLFAMASALAVTMEWISDFGIGDRLVQQDDEHLRESFDSAVVLHLIGAIVLWGIVMTSAPVLAHFYHQPALRPLIAAMSYTAFTGFLRLPLFLFYRDLNYFLQRLLVFVGRLSGFIVTLALAYAGAGLWCLVAGGAVTLAVTAVPAWWLSPLRPRWRISFTEIRPLIGFSSPLWVSKLAYVVVQQGSVLLLSAFLAVDEVGRFKAAEQLAGFVLYLEVVLGQTLFPIFCRVKDSPGMLGNAFSKASRISMFWIAGGSLALVVFANDIVQFVLTPKWHGAELFIRAQGIALLFGATMFSWESLFKARNVTRPIFHLAVVFAAAFLTVFVPLVYFGGTVGAAVGLVALNIIILAARKFAIDRLGLGISVLAITRRAVLAASVAGLFVVLGRETFFPQATVAALAFRVSVYIAIYASVLLCLERELIRDALAQILPAGHPWGRRAARAAQAGSS